MKVIPLKNCAVEITDCDLSNLTDDEYQQIKDILLDKLIIVFRNQSRKTIPFAKLIFKMGNRSIANWSQSVWDVNGNRLTDIPEKPINPFTFKGPDDMYPVQRVTGQLKEGKRSGIFGTGKLDWHSNYNGPGRANCVALQGMSEGIRNTSTSFMDTTLAYADMPEELKKRCEGVIGHFEYAPEIWAEGLPDDQLAYMKPNAVPYEMPLINTGFNGKKGLYFHFLNKCTFPTDPSLLDELKKFCLNEKYIYTHFWEPGDVILMEQILTIHKRDQDDADILKERVLLRYTFHLDDSKVKKESPPKKKPESLWNSIKA